MYRYTAWRQVVRLLLARGTAPLRECERGVQHVMLGDAGLRAVDCCSHTVDKPVDCIRCLLGARVVSAMSSERINGMSDVYEIQALVECDAQASNQKREKHKEEIRHSYRSSSAA